VQRCASDGLTANGFGWNKKTRLREQFTGVGAEKGRPYCALPTAAKNLITAEPASRAASNRVHSEA